MLIDNFEQLPRKMSLWKFSVVSGFSYMLYGKKGKLGNAGS